MTREVCEGYTGTKKEYRKSGCLRCDYHRFFDGGVYEPSNHYCDKDEPIKIMEIPFKEEEWIIPIWKKLTR